MNYMLLPKLYYKNKEEYDALYQARSHSADSAYFLPFEVSGSPAFIVISKEVLHLVERIYFRNNKLTRLYNQLPTAAIAAYMKESTVEEILLSNDIEGVYSTKKELRVVMKKTSSKKPLRFEALAKKYMKILEDAQIPLQSSKDVRALYDEIMLPEIEKEQQPDGAFFRKDSVSVYDERDKEIHMGLYPEKKLIEFMDKALLWLGDEDVPHIIRIAAFHYLFGYMHPFYDGNGRMGRFISSYLLKETLNFLVSLKISYIINSQKREYYKAFQTCNDTKNKGDLTPFVITFLNIIHTAIETLIADLTESCAKLDHYEDILERDYSGRPKSAVERSILKFLMQYTLFSDEGMNVATLVQITGNSEMWIRKYLNQLMNQHLVTRERDGRSMYYFVNLDTLDTL